MTGCGFESYRFNPRIVADRAADLGIDCGAQLVDILVRQILGTQRGRKHAEHAPGGPRVAEWPGRGIE